MLTDETAALLLLAALLFWGWQSGLLLFGAIMGLVLESARFIKARWDLTGEDFRRLWNFACCWRWRWWSMFSPPTRKRRIERPASYFSRRGARNAGISATTFLRWLPMTLFLFVAAQRFSEHGSVPLSAISLLVRRRQKGSAEAERNVNVSYPYFIVCLFSAGIHANDGDALLFLGTGGFDRVGVVAAAFAAFWHHRLAWRAGGGDRAGLFRPARHWRVAACVRRLQRAVDDEL